MSREWIIIGLVAVVASLMMVLGSMPAPAAQDSSYQSGIADARQPATAGASEPASTAGQGQSSDLSFWRHARDPFAIPNAAKLCAEGVVVACATPSPSD